MSEENKNNNIIIDQAINELKGKLANLPDCQKRGIVTVVLTIHDPCSYPQQSIMSNIAAKIDDLVLQGGKASYNIVRLES